MSKSNKLLMKLIRASGGWENFLYETLKELCKDVTGLYSADGINRELQLAVLIEEVMEIIEAYEEQQGVGIKTHNIKLTPTLKVKELNVQAKIAEPVKSVPLPPLQPQKMKAKVGIDKDAGWCQGELPIPAGHMIVNKGQLTVTTVTGLEMARGNEDGQVKSQDVSGQISSRGKYRLVFKDVNLGAALINFEMMPAPALPPAPVRQVLVAAQQITPAMITARDVEMKAAKEATLAATEAVAEVVAKAIPVDPPRPEGGMKQCG